MKIFRLALIGLLVGFLVFFFYRESSVDPVYVKLGDPDLDFDESNLELVMKYDLDRPEGLLMDESKEHFYTGTGNGEFLKVNIETGEVEVLLTGKDFNPEFFKPYGETDVGEYCNGGIFREGDCGRILGIDYDDEGRIIITNAYFGIYLYDTDTKELSQLLDTGHQFINDVAYSKKDMMIYYTLSHPEYKRFQFLFVIFDGHPGSLHKLDPSTGKEETVMEGIYFANGVEVSSNGDFLYVVEMGRRRLIKYSIEDQSHSYLMENTPFYIDNISMDYSKGTILAVGVPYTWFAEYLLQHPRLLRWITRTPKIVHIIFFIKTIINDYGIAMEIDEASGEIVNVIYDKQGEVFKIGATMERIEENEYLVSSVFYNAVRFREI